jgi:PKHD-type hydroxylase
MSDISNNRAKSADLMNIVSTKNVFTNEELDLIIKLGTSEETSTGLGPARVGQNLGASDETGYSGSLDNEIRRCSVSGIGSSTEADWIFDRVREVVRDANIAYFNFNINAIAPLQLVKYDGTNLPEFYHRHVDLGFSEIDAQRKLSVTVQLSDPNDYDGGDLILYHISGGPVTANREQGAITIFPSFISHEVTPVTRGIRYSLVAWTLGPAFR